MKAKIFYEYITNVFHLFLIENNFKFPVFLFIDGHKSHLTYHLSNIRSKLSIVFIALYPNATKILQPADVVAFRPLKSGWKKDLFEWRNNNPNCTVTTKDFASILKNVIANTVRDDILINVFRACGLYPWDVNQIDFKKCLEKNQFAEPNDTTDRNIFENTNKNTFPINQLNFKEFCEVSL